MFVSKRKTKPVVDQLPKRVSPDRVNWLMENFAPLATDGGYAWTVAPAGSKFASLHEVTADWAARTQLPTHPHVYKTREEAVAALRVAVEKAMEASK